MAKQSRERAQILDVQAATALGGSLVANDTMLTGVWITAALAGTLTITGFANASNDAAANFVLPVATAAGLYNPGGMVNAKGQMTAALSAAGDVSKIVVRTQPVSGM